MKAYYELLEGVYDQNIFKAFFMAGGPGSGKSYVVRKSTGGTGLKIVNSDEAFERLLKQAGLSLKMPDNELIARDKIRDKAKALTDKRKGNYIEGRLGLIIDGTGKDYNKITKQASDLKNIGYDVHMIFVNTSLDVALENNQRRARTLKDSIVKYYLFLTCISLSIHLFASGLVIFLDKSPLTLLKQASNSLPSLSTSLLSTMIKLAPPKNL